MDICKYNDISKNNDVKRPFDSESRIKPNWFNGKLFRFYKDRQNDMPGIRDDVKNTKTVSPRTKVIMDLGRDHSHYPPPWVSSQCWTLLGASSFLISLLLTSFKSSLSSYPSGCFCLVFFAVSSYLNTIEIFHVCSVFQQQISPVLFHFLS